MFGRVSQYGIGFLYPLVWASLMSLIVVISPLQIQASPMSPPDKVESLEAAQDCPSKETKVELKDPWQGSDAFDVAYISKGERVEIEEHLVKDKFTIVDFGAPWCGPCYTAADEIKVYLNSHSDVAVRVVSLHAPSAAESYNLPVFDQHLSAIPGIPYFLVFDASGRQIYKGQRVDAVTKVIDKVRGL